MWHVWERVSVYNILVGKPVGLRPLVRRDHRWEDNSEMYIIEGRGLTLYSCTSGQGQVTGCCEHGGEPLSSVKYGEFID